MIYDYGLYYEISDYLKSQLPDGVFVKVPSLSMLEQYAREGDLAIFFGWGKGNMAGQRRLIDKGVILAEDGELSLKLGNKVEQLRYVDTLTSFPLSRVFVENTTGRVKQHKVPEMNGAAKVVFKIGNSHQGRDKHLESPGTYFSTPENVIFEQFVPNARSIRVIIIGGTHIFLVEQTKDSDDLDSRDEWIKNICTNETMYTYENRAALCIPNVDDIISDALKLQNILNIGYVGIDYVVSENLTGLLEVNDMIGLPNNPLVFEAAKNYWLNICIKYLKTKGVY